MYYLLIVDDEPISADGIAAYLEEEGGDNWQIRTYYSAAEALEHAQERIDVLIVDIIMPGMDGFELVSRLLPKWPQMKVIFMTANPKVDNAQRAIRGGVMVDYVLKTEELGMLLSAVHKAVGEIERQMRDDRQRKSIEWQAQQALPLLRKDYMMRLLRQGEAEDVMEKRFSQLAMPLTARLPVLMLAASYGAHTGDGFDEDIAFFTLENLIQKYMGGVLKWYAMPAGDGRAMFFFQTDEMDAASCLKYVLSAFDAVQQTFQRMVGHAAIVLDDALCAWQQVPARYRALLRALERNLMLDADALVRSSHMDALAAEESSVDIRTLRALLERGEGEQLAAMLRNLSRNYPRLPMSRVELYRLLLKLFSHTISLRDDANQFFLETPMPSLQLSEEGFTQMMFDFAKLALRLTQTSQTDSRARLDSLAARVRQYVTKNIGTDLSLTAMAERIHHSPTYFSKLFKAATGIGYAEYILGMRMEKSGSLLLETRDTVSDIAQSIGYMSTSYFIRMFKKAYGMTPAEYRRAHGIE